MTRWELLHPQMTHDMLGYIPDWLDESDPDKARDQIDKNYRHGGGWFPMKGFTHQSNYELAYPGDPLLKPLALAKFRHEVVVFYPHSIVGIFQPDGSFDAARID